jgi:hypothetical protein
MLRFALVLASLTALIISLGCGKDDPDPIGTICKSSCKLDADHVCYSSVADCENRCRTQATQDEKKRAGCGTCIAQQYVNVYSVNTKPPCDTTPTVSCCWGLLQINETDTCLTKCFEPDGSVP